MFPTFISVCENQSTFMISHHSVEMFACTVGVFVEENHTVILIQICFTNHITQKHIDPLSGPEDIKCNP